MNMGNFAGGMAQGMNQMRLKQMMMGGQQGPQAPMAMGPEELNPLPLEGGGGYEGFQAQPQQQGKFGSLKDLMMRLFGG